MRQLKQVWFVVFKQPLRYATDEFKTSRFCCTKLKIQALAWIFSSCRYGAVYIETLANIKFGQEPLVFAIIYEAWRVGGAVTQRSAKPFRRVRLSYVPP